MSLLNLTHKLSFEPVFRMFIMNGPMYNGPPVNVTDRPFVNIVHYQYVPLFLISLFELKLGPYSVYLS